MQISSTSSSSTPSPRSVTSAKNSSDRQSDENIQEMATEKKTQENIQQQRKIEDNLQQKNENDQRRLDGRLISFGQDNSANTQEKQASINRSRVNDAYNPVNNEPNRSNEQQPRSTKNKNAEAIDVVV